MPSPLSNVVYMPRPAPSASPLGALAIQLPNHKPAPSREKAALKTELDDGSVLINLHPGANANTAPKSDKFDANLALELDDATLNGIAAELLRGIAADEQSRSDWLETHAEGIKLLGLIIEDSRGDVGTSSAPLEGMSRFYHPLLLEAVLLFQANARGELLPAAGPVKVRDDQAEKQAAMPVPAPAPTMPMPPPGIGHNGGPPLSPLSAAPAPMPPVAGVPPGALPPHPVPPPGAPMPVGPAAGPAMPPPGAAGPIPSPMPAPAPLANAAAPMPPAPIAPPVPTPPAAPDRTVLANALEKDFNHYLTVTDQSYVPDTDQMLVKVGFGGLGIKKVYNCPIRRRPVSESVPIEDFIVSNALTDLSNAGRITHRSKMRPSTFRRLQILGVYRDVNVGQPTNAEQPNAVEQAKAEVVGVQPQVQDPKDADYTILECYCELGLDQFAPRKFKGKELPLPYRVTIEKDSQKILDIRRNWREDDPECLAREFFVEFPYVKAFGFYGLGLLHILGNTTKALTAMTREMIDAGMFASFPGFLYAKGAGRQLTNQFRVAPGQGVGLDVGLQKLQDAVMPLPYKMPDAGFVAFKGSLEQMGQRLGGTANISVGEGKQDAPVGTTLALLEQAAKPTGAVMKRLFSAQGKELILLKERFRDDPEAFWRFNKKPAMAWQKEQLLTALNDFELVPVADPNNPTGLHRKAKGMVKQQLAQAAPGLFDLRKTAVSIGDDYEMDIEPLLAPPQPPGPPPGPQAPPVDPAKMAQVQQKAQSDAAELQARQQESQMENLRTQAEMADRAAEREHQLQIATMEQQTERLRLAATLAVHSDKTDAAERALTMKIGADHASQAQDQLHGLQTQARDHLHDVVTTAAAAPQAREPQP